MTRSALLVFRPALCALLFLVSTLRLEAYEWSVYAGADGGPGAVDATGTAARFNNPRGVAVDPQAGNAYVADSSNYTIRQVTPGGVVTTLAGLAGVSGHVDATGAAARFLFPQAIARRPDGSLAVADGQYLRAVALDGTVTTLAGTGASGHLDGPAAQATFFQPSALAVDTTTGNPTSGNIYLIDGSAVRVLTAAGQVMTLAGSPTETGDVDATGSAARFGNDTYGLTLGPDGNLYVPDNDNGKIRRVTPAGEVTTYATSIGAGALLADLAGNLYAGQNDNIYKVDVAPGHAATLFAGGNGNGYLDGPVAVAKLNNVFGLAFSTDGALLAVDYNNHALRKITLAGVVSTLAGKGIPTGNDDGTGTAATFHGPQGLGVDAAGNVYVADELNFTIRRIAPGGVVTTWAGQAGIQGTVDDTGTAARFYNPWALAAQADGTLYVTDTYSQLLRKITPQALVSTVAGTAFTTGAANGQGTLASFNYAQGVGVAPAGGKIAVGDTGNHAIRTVTPQGLVATLAGMVGQTGAVDASGLNASFSNLQGVAVDAAGDVYVADAANQKIRKVTSAGVVTTLAGGGGFGLVDGVGVDAQFGSPTGVAVDATGNVFVADNGTHAIRKVTPSGRVITLGGNGTSGTTLGVGTAARFNYPAGIAVGPTGTLYVSDANQRIVQGVDTSTEPPFLTTPLAGSATSSPVTVTYELTEPGLSGSVTVKFAPQFGSPVTLTLTAAYATEGIHTFSFNSASLVTSAAIASISGGTSLPDGTYTVTLSYQDALSNPAATAVATNVKIDTVTQTPSIGQPINHNTLSTAGSISGFVIIVPEPALAGSVKLIFTNGLAAPQVLTLGTLPKGTSLQPVIFNPAAPNFPGNSNNPSVTGSAIPDGTYTLTLSYQDALGNPAATASQAGVIVDTVTQTLTAGSFTAPATNAVVGTLITVKFTLPEAAGIAQISFGGATLSLDPSLITAGVETTLTFDPSDPVGTSGGAITNGPAIPDGTSTVTLAYRDVGLNALASVAHSNVRVDTTPPAFVLPQNGVPVQRVAAGTLPDFTTLIPTTDAGAVTVTQSPLASAVTTFTGQPITVTLTAKDAAGNTSTYDLTVDVRPLAPVHTVLFNGSTKAGLPGSAVPGAGTFADLPGDAIFASFQPPAIDSTGHVAFIGKWTSATGPAKKGTGIFTDTGCVALIGGLVPNANGARYKTLSDPVVSQGHVAFLATLSGAPKGQESVVLSDAPSNGTLAIIAQSGVDAHTVDAAIFKSFKDVQILGNIVGFFAQVTSGIGGTKVTAANDYGLWAQNGAGSLSPVVREGDVVDANATPPKKIKTLVSFAVGAGSAGQGRGWVGDPYTDSMLALALLDDKAKSQAVLGGLEGNPPVIYAQTGSTTGGAPALSGASFQSFGFPTTNSSNYTTAFLGKLTVGTPASVTKANAQGIFLAPSVFNPNQFATVARLTNPAGNTGAAFSVLKDPVLADDGALAFSATIKGPGVNGAAATTLWWKPAGAALKLLAQGGHQQGVGVPGIGANAEWKTFPSLAIASTRGPIFTGTLASIKGVVAAAETNGVWAVDFTGEPQLLFQTGKELDVNGKTLKSFTFLTAVPGSVGVTRGFTDNALTVWLATFTDGTTAIVKTVVP